MMCAGDLPLLAALVYAYAFPSSWYIFHLHSHSRFSSAATVYAHFLPHYEIIPFISSFTVNASYSLVGLARHTAVIMTPCTGSHCTHSRCFSMLTVSLGLSFVPFTYTFCRPTSISSQRL